MSVQTCMREHTPRRKTHAQNRQQPATHKTIIYRLTLYLCFFKPEERCVFYLAVINSADGFSYLVSARGFVVKQSMSSSNNICCSNGTDMFTQPSCSEMVLQPRDKPAYLFLFHLSCRGTAIFTQQASLPFSFRPAESQTSCVQILRYPLLTSQSLFRVCNMRPQHIM